MVGLTAGTQEEEAIEIAREGGTVLRLPVLKGRGKGPAQRRAVFFNPAMALSRDLTLSFAVEESRRTGRRLTMWDAMAATGIRGLRLLSETDAVERVLATENNTLAMGVLKLNAQNEGSGRMVPLFHDSRGPPPGGPFDLVDIDPYGTPIPFLRAGVLSVREGGILAVTATDMAVLAGPGRSTCEKRYSAQPLRGYLSREAAMRILLASIMRVCSDEGRKARVVLSMISGYYVRCHLRLSSADDPDDRAPGMGIGMIPFSGYRGPPLPRTARAGPMWLGNLHSTDFVKNMDIIRTPGSGGKSLEAFLNVLRAESGVDLLFYYETGQISKFLGLKNPPSREDIFSALREGGHAVARTHASPDGWRTTASLEEVGRTLLALQ